MIALAAGLFWILGWSAVQPPWPADPLSMLRNPNPLQVLLVGAVLSSLMLTGSIVFSGKWVKTLAPAAIPMGLTVWAILSHTMESLMLQETDAAGRAGMYQRFAMESWVWFLLAASGCWITNWYCRVRGLNKENPPLKSDSAGSRYIMVRDPRLSFCFAAAGMCLASILLLKVFAQSGRIRIDSVIAIPVLATIPAKGQIVFAVTAAFFLSAMGMTQVVKAPLWCYLLGCPLTACVFYLFAAKQGLTGPMADVSPLFLPASLIPASILPIEYIGIGSLAVLAGCHLGNSFHLPKEEKKA